MSFNINDELKKSKEYRDAFVAAHVRNGIAFQLRAMRNGRGWDQKSLAKMLGNEKLQPLISRYENPDYGRFSVSTLLDLARVFDVALEVRFAPFNAVVAWDSMLSPNSLNVPSFEAEQTALPFPTSTHTFAFFVKTTVSATSDAFRLQAETGTTAAVPDLPKPSIEPYFEVIPRAIQHRGGNNLWKSQVAE